MPDPSPPKAVAQIALLLPLSGRLAEAGETVRDGFMAAAYARPTAVRPSIRVYDYTTDAAAAYRRAVEEGANFIVGPLGRENVTAVRSVADGHVPVLALNHLADSDAPPKRFFQFGLAPEDEAHQIALRALQEGQKVGAILVPTGDWGLRVRQAFTTAFTSGGGRVVTSETYPTDTTDFSDILVPLLGFEDSQKRHRAVSSLVGSPLVFTPRRRDDLEFLFFAGQPVLGRLIRPQLKFHYAGDLPVYATSDIYDPRASSNQDLEGVVFVDMPWLLAESDAVAGIRRSVGELWPGDARHAGRLFALGYDAAVLAEHLRNDEDIHGLQGLTGTLTLGTTGRIHRSLLWASIGADGTAKPLDR
jgi:uncharacterized protein